MSRRNIFVGDTSVKVNDREVEGAFVDFDGERFYRISNVDRMPDFFISLVSASDQWMFISSNGALTAGRKNAERSLFPYYSEDKIHDYRGKTGSRTLLLVTNGDRLKLWEPFTGSDGLYPVRRNLYKNLLSNKLVFEEINEELGLCFRYGWYNSDRFGFVKQSTLFNLDSRDIEVELLDGLQNILPCSVNPGLQLSSSNLLDAYKRQELVAGTTLGIYRLSSVPSDTAEPSEALKVNTVWSEGLENSMILLSGLQLEAFRTGYALHPEYDIKATRGAYFVHASLKVPAGAVSQWRIIAEVHQDAAAVARLAELLKSGIATGKLVQNDIDRSSSDLISLLAASDALQCTEDEPSTSRHLSNVLFNVMRGGIFAENYRLSAADFLDFVAKANAGLAGEAKEMLDSCGESVLYMDLLEKASRGRRPDLHRLCYEYLALSFSRRHGDPSRPWNRFSIENRKEDGSINLDYQGNWRDIFQNWEALGRSFPGYLESMISKFVNASTADGYNPYRITRDGIDWEVPDPSDPWSNIGYWGDHQVIYLLKLLEISANHHPELLQQLLSLDVFSYANVPYRIKAYGDLLRDPRNTISFDHSLEELIKTRVGALGSDGKLLWNKKGEVVLVNLAEKLLLTLFTKLSNFIPGAGIWMNTQRPEWNDANNALVGNGVSMVTACYLRAYVKFCSRLFGGLRQDGIKLSLEVADFFTALNEALREVLRDPEGMMSSTGMKRSLDLFGEAGSVYRMDYYRKGFSGRRRETALKELLSFFERTLEALDRTISSSRREDRLYHAYNLIRVQGDQIILRRLYEMLEGQVAVLGSGFLPAEEALELLDALKGSKLFRADQYSYILYPDRRLPAFLDTNIIPAGEVARSELLQALLEHADSSVVVKDVGGVCHFHADFRNAGCLDRALDALPEAYAQLVKQEKRLVLDIYERVFDHQSFTGRSGTFYGYEGLGSIYWHMVSKLLLAVGDTFYNAAKQGVKTELLGRLAAHYYEIRAGIGLNKTPDVYGAFPTDPYSHTPGNRGAQQPGMTGQVKEDILARWGELGLVIRGGSIYFDPILLRGAEFLSAPRKFTFRDLKGENREVLLGKDCLAFTYCQVPFIYHRSEEPRVEALFRDGSRQLIPGNTLGVELSAGIFMRSGELVQVEVWLSPGL